MHVRILCLCVSLYICVCICVWDSVHFILPILCAHQCLSVCALRALASVPPAVVVFMFLYLHVPVYLPLPTQAFWHKIKLHNSIGTPAPCGNRGNLMLQLRWGKKELRHILRTSILIGWKRAIYKARVKGQVTVASLRRRIGRSGVPWPLDVTSDHQQIQQGAWERWRI
jgi:hypothetical protein